MFYLTVIWALMYVLKKKTIFKLLMSNNLTHTFKKLLVKTLKNTFENFNIWYAD